MSKKEPSGGGGSEKAGDARGPFSSSPNRVIVTGGKAAPSKPSPSRPPPPKK